MSRIDTHEVAEWITDALEREPPDVCKLIVTHVSQGRGRHLIQVARERMPTLPQRAQQHLAAIAAARGERI